MIRPTRYIISSTANNKNWNYTRNDDDDISWEVYACTYARNVNKTAHVRVLELCNATKKKKQRRIVGEVRNLHA